MKQILASLRTRAAQWISEERGNLTVEFVMLMPIAIAVFFASVEASVVTLRKTYLDRALDMTVRELRLGKIDSPTADKIKEKICARMTMVDDCTQNLTVELNVQQTASNTGESISVPSLSSICVPREANVDPVGAPNFASGVANDLVLVRVCLVQSIIFPTSATQLTKPVSIEVGDTVNEKYQLISTTAFVNEPR